MTKKITLSQAAKLLDKKYPQIIRMIRKGELKAEKVGWIWVLDRSEVRRLRRKLLKKAQAAA